MTHSISSASTYAELVKHADSHDLKDLVNDMPFVVAVKSQRDGQETDARYALLEVLTDKFHDHFKMDARQRKQTTTAMLERTHSISELYGMFSMMGESRPTSPAPVSTPAPAVTSHTAKG